VLKASRFLEELPGEPPLYERWQLDEEAGVPALAASAGRPVLAAFEVPALFAPREGSGPDGGDAPS
jgi:DNA helicase II / ATP-dependent DNA helicase PcrA